MERNEIGDMSKLKIVESFKCKSQVVISAHEAAEMILRVDQIITWRHASVSALERTERRAKPRAHS